MEHELDESCETGATTEEEAAQERESSEVRHTTQDINRDSGQVRGESLSESLTETVPAELEEAWERPQGVSELQSVASTELLSRSREESGSTLTTRSTSNESAAGDGSNPVMRRHLVMLSYGFYLHPQET